MTPSKNLEKAIQQLKKRTTFAIMAMLITVAVNAQMKIAVLDFKAGTGVERGDVEGISAIFSTYFMEPSKFTLVERTQIDRVIAEQGFQYSTLTNQQMVRVGQLLNIKKMVVGNVNIISGQYNVDVRIVDVETGVINATEGATWARGTSYRDLMKNLATKLIAKINITPDYISHNLGSETGSNSEQNLTTPKTVITLLGYLQVFPEDIGAFSVVPTNVISAINQQAMHNYNNWRLPTKEELELLNSNIRILGMNNIVSYAYDGSWNNSSSSLFVRLVRTEQSKEPTENPSPNDIPEKSPYLDKTRHDFGVVSMSNKYFIAIFTVLNPTNETLYIERVATRCGCLVAEWTQNAILHGESGRITVTYNATGRLGTINKTIIAVLSNGEVLKMGLHGYVE